MASARKGPVRALDVVVALPGPLLAPFVLWPQLFPRSPIAYLVPVILFTCLFQVLFSIAAILRDGARVAGKYLLWAVAGAFPILAVAARFVVLR